MFFIENQLATVTEVVPQRIFLGNADSLEHCPEIEFTHVINLSNFSNDRPDLHELHLHINDMPTTNIYELFPETNKFINEALNDENSIVLVHCQQGISRSVTIICAWLMSQQAAKGEEASLQSCLDTLKKERPMIAPNHGFMTQLLDYENALNGKLSSQPATSP